MARLAIGFGPSIWAIDLTDPPGGAKSGPYDEAHLPAPQHPPGPHARLSRPDADPRGAQGSIESAPQGSLAAHSQGLQEVAGAACLAPSVEAASRDSGGVPISCAFSRSGA